MLGPYIGVTPRTEKENLPPGLNASAGILPDPPSYREVAHMEFGRFLFGLTTPASVTLLLAGRGHQRRLAAESCQ